VSHAGGPLTAANQAKEGVVKILDIKNGASKVGHRMFTTEFVCI